LPNSIDERSVQTEPAPKPPSTDPYDPAEKREITRAQLASGLAVLLGVVGLLLIVLTAWGKLKLDETKDLADAIYSPIVVLTGTALGFYFGVHQGGR
jgi:hypothetical protein